MEFIPALARSARRAAGALLFVAGALAVAAPLRAGAAESAADHMVLELSRGVLDAIRADPRIRAGEFERIQKLVEERIFPKVDFDKMTRLAVGRPWRGATPEQRSALIAQFRTLLLRTYAGALSRVTDHTVRLRPSHGQEGADEVIVRTEIVAGQGDPIALDYRLYRSDKSEAGWYIYDVDILGVWLVENYKNEFATILNQGGVDALIRDLTRKNEAPASGARRS